MKQISLKRFLWMLPILISVSAAAQSPQPELVVQRGHAAAIEDVDFSKDGRLMLSCGLGGDARLWDLESGMMLRSFSGSYEHCSPKFVLGGRLMLLKSDATNKQDS